MTAKSLLQNEMDGDPLSVLSEQGIWTGLPKRTTGQAKENN